MLVENVKGFETSDTRDKLLSTLQSCDYIIQVNLRTYTYTHTHILSHIVGHGKVLDSRMRGAMFDCNHFKTFGLPHIAIVLQVIQWLLLSSVYARGSNISHTGSKCLTCHGLANSSKGK